MTMNSIYGNISSWLVAGLMLSAACTEVNVGDGIEGPGPDGGAIVTGDVARFEGCYWGSYSGSDSGLLEVTVNAVGGVTITAGGSTYSGSVDGSGNINVQGTLNGNYTITYTGYLPELALGREGGGTWESSSGYTGTWGLNEAPLVGSYSGAYSSSVENGAITAEVTCDQSLTVVASTPRGPEIYSGFVERSGAVSASGIITGTTYAVQYTGQFQVSGSGRQGAGQWSSTSGFSGTWTASGGN